MSAFGAIGKGCGGKALVRESLSSVPHILALSALLSSGGGVTVIIASLSLVLEQLIMAV